MTLYRKHKITKPNGATRGVSYDQIRSDYGLFLLAMNPLYTYEHFQQDIIIPVMEAIIAKDMKFQETAFILPYGHSKTDLGTLNFLPFYFGHYPDSINMLITYGKKFSRRLGKGIRDRMERPLYLELFPQAQIKRTSRAMDEFETISGGKFYAEGFDTSINGTRVNGVLIIDDPHKRKETAESEIQMDHMRETYKSVVESRCEPRCFKILNTTRHAPNDFAGWRFGEDGAWDVLRGKEYEDGLAEDMGVAEE